MPAAPAWWPFLAWPALGTAVGVTVGLALTSGGSPLASASWPVLGVLVLVAGAAIGVRAQQKRSARARANAPRVPVGHKVPRAPPAPAKAARPAAPAAPRTPLACALAFPDLDAPAADVWGVGEPLRVRVTARRGTAGVPGASARVTARANGVTREIARGVADARGHADAVVTLTDEGEHAFAVTVDADEESASATAHVRLVRYEEEVKRVFDALTEWARAHAPGAKDALTAREVVEALAHAASDAESARALEDVLGIYEIVTYGERPADRALYVDLLSALERADPAFKRLEAGEAPRA